MWGLLGFDPLDPYEWRCWAKIHGTHSIHLTILFYFLSYFSLVTFFSSKKGDFFGNYWYEITYLNHFLSFYYIIKWFFHKDLCFILFFMLTSFYRRLVCRQLCYDVVLFVFLLRLFNHVRAIQTGKTDLIS